jgi:hypothetical protein
LGFSGKVGGDNQVHHRQFLSGGNNDFANQQQ